jgi:hypothetical protein
MKQCANCKQFRIDITDGESSIGWCREFGSPKTTSSDGFCSEYANNCELHIKPEVANETTNT